MRRYKFLSEDAPVNAVATGHIAGVGIANPTKPDNWGEPGIKKKKKIKIMRRKPVMEAEEGTFAGSKTFIVPPEIFHNVRLSKKDKGHWTKYLGDDEHGKRIREYANRDSKAPVILQDKTTGAMCFARYGKKKT